MWKLIGSGYEGDVFVSTDKRLIKKVFHIPNDEKLPDYRFSVWREIEFSNIASQYPHFYTIGLKKKHTNLRQTISYFYVIMDY